MAVRDSVIDFVTCWRNKTGFGVGDILTFLGLPKSKYYAWKARYGQPNRHNASLPKTYWLLKWEHEAIISSHLQHPDVGYRRLSFMMLDADEVAASPSSVYRVLKRADLLKRGSKPASKKGKGFDQPTRAHQHWHVDVSYINICGTFYYLCAILDGYSRYIVHFEIRERMTESDIEIIIQRGREKFPGVKPRIISDNGPQFIAIDFKSFIRHCGMTHVRTSPFYPQSNGKIERWHQSMKRECIRPKTPTTLDEARRVVTEFVSEYNHHRLHAAIGYVAPVNKLLGKEQIIFQDRKRKLNQARLKRAQVAFGAVKQVANL
jgi:putative transposase